MSQEPFIAIAIINYNGREVTDKCLKSLKITNYKNYKVFLLDNGSSTDDYTYFKKKYKNINVFKSPKNLGYAPGMNFLWKKIFDEYNPDYICNLNNDIITIDKDWLKKMVEILEKKPEYGICGNKLVYSDYSLQIDYYSGNPIVLKIGTVKDNGQFDYIKDVNSIVGANMFIKRKLISDIGGLDSNFFYGPDDIDYCYRARKAGFKIIYNGKSKVMHIGSTTSTTLTDDYKFKPLCYGYLLLSYRHDNWFGKIKTTIHYFAKIFVSKKEFYKRISINNLQFHITFPKRFIYFCEDFIKAIKNYDKIQTINIPK